ncbi:MAG TPA: DMT family transporter [Gemmatimonadaceae bacterium]
MTAAAREDSARSLTEGRLSNAGHQGRGKAYAALAVAGCLWGTGFFFGKIDLAEMGVGHMLLYRFLFACLGLLPVAFKHRAKPRLNDVPLFLLAAALYGPIQFLVQFEGLAHTTVSHASLMVGTLPLLLAVGAVAFTHERLDRTGWLTLVVSSMGAVLIVVQAHSNAAATGGPSLLGDVLVLISMLAGVGWVLVTQRVMHARRGYSPIVMSVYIIALGTIMLAAWVLVVDGLPPVTFSARAWMALAAQGLLSTTAPTLLWNWALMRVPAARAGIFINFEPVVGTLLGVALLHESLGPAAAAGGVMIVGAATAFTFHAPTAHGSS